MLAARFRFLPFVVRQGGREAFSAALWAGAVGACLCEICAIAILRSSLLHMTDVLKILAVGVLGFALITGLATGGIVTFLALAVNQMTSLQWAERHGEKITAPERCGALLDTEIRRRRVGPKGGAKSAKELFGHLATTGNFLALGGEARFRVELISRILSGLRHGKRKVIVYDPDRRLVGSHRQPTSDTVCELGDPLKSGWDPVAEGLSPHEFAAFLRAILPSGPIAVEGGQIVLAAYAFLAAKPWRPSIATLRTLLENADDTLLAILIEQAGIHAFSARGLQYGLDLLSAFERAAGPNPIRVLEWAKTVKAGVLVLTQADGKTQEALDFMLGLAIRRAKASGGLPPHLVFVRPPQFGVGLMPSLTGLVSWPAPICLAADGFSEIQDCDDGLEVPDFLAKFGEQFLLKPTGMGEAQDLARYLEAVVGENHARSQKAWWRSKFPRIGKSHSPPLPRSLHDLVNMAPDAAIVRLQHPERDQRPLPLFETRVHDSSELGEQTTRKGSESGTFQPPPEPETMSLIEPPVEDQAGIAEDLVDGDRSLPDRQDQSPAIDDVIANLFGAHGLVSTAEDLRGDRAIEGLDQLAAPAVIDKDLGHA